MRGKWSSCKMRVSFVLGQVGTAAEKAKQAEYPLENFRLHWAMGTH